MNFLNQRGFWWLASLGKCDSAPAFGENLVRILDCTISLQVITTLVRLPVPATVELHISVDTGSQSGSCLNDFRGTGILVVLFSKWHSTL